jgi:hypothetical protein
LTIIREKKVDSDLEEIRLLYSQLYLFFNQVARAFTDWPVKKEGVIHEARESSVEKARRALDQINMTLTRLKTVEQKYKFDKRVLAEHYREQLNGCKTYVEGIVNELNTIWESGRPSKREVPFGDSTNYRFIMKKLLKCVNEANKTSSKINKKTSVFNRVNKDLLPLPKIPDNMTAPAWARNV